MDLKHVVLVHGASHGAWCWYKVVAMLQNRGFTVAAIDLTSMGRDKTSPDWVSSIAQFARPLLDYLENVNGKVLLMGHSLGGITVSYAMEKLPNKIRKAVFLVSRMPLNNQSFITSIPSNVTPPSDFLFCVFLFPSVSVEFSLEHVRNFYHDCREEDVQLALLLLSPQPYAVYSENLTLTRERYGSVPRVYIFTSEDRVRPREIQELYVDLNPPQEVYRIDSGHSPFFSKPLELTIMIEIIQRRGL
ncbi:hypothetical protein R1sor_006727 [Riccia sorocarpa]|uniref:AB hydrolase-1 domain-containing protein n=1 Tax=Riccia sorocarpa TaxID=122646 RepID=A0ABD3HQ66_9MARC